MKIRFALVLTLALAANAYADEVKDVWNAKCKSCHGEDGKAKTKMGEKEKIPDFTTAKFDAQGRGYKPRSENTAVDESEIPEYDESNETPVEEEPTPDADEPPPV